MADFKSSLFPIITSVIGSGLLLFVLNNIAAEINQPHIYLQVNSFSGNNSKQQQETKFQTIVLNDGRSAATNVRLTLLYPSANIINYSIPFHNENITSLKLEGPTSLIAEIDRLSKGATVIINTTVIKKDAAIVGSHYKYYAVSATFDQGTNTIFNLSSPAVRVQDIEKVIPLNLRLLIVTTFLALICFLMGLFYKRIKHFRFQINRPKLVFDVVREMVTVRDMLKKNILSTTIFPILRWNSIEDETKRQIFSDHRDYNLINDFYKDLKQRDSDFSQKDISDQTLREKNEHCFNQVDYTLEKVCWSSYHPIGYKKFHIIISVASIIFSALLIFFIFEVFRVIFFLPIQDFPEPYQIVYNILTSMSRSIVAFLLAREIINFQSESTYDFSANNDTISHISLSSSRYGLAKLFAFSVLIMGTPLFLLSGELNYVGRSDLAYDFFIIILLIDVARMFILSFIVPRYTMKRIIKIREPE
jgi:hypothetical protein